MLNLLAWTAAAALASSWSWQDGAETVVATPVAHGATAALSDGLQDVELHYSRGRHTRAQVGRNLVVQLPSSKEDVTTVLARAGLVPIKHLMPETGMWLVRDAHGAGALETVARVQQATKAFHIWPDLWLRRRAAMPIPPNDPRYAGQWYLQQLDMEPAWALSTGNSSTTIMVVDNGCDLTHPDLVAKMDPGKDVVAGDDDPSFAPNSEGNAHGTSCAGLAAASTNNATGIAGTCPECRLRCVRLLGDGSQATPLSGDVEAYAFALSTNVAVVSNSWGFVEAIPVPTALKNAIEAVVDRGRDGKGALMLFASGNDDRRVDLDELLAVRGVIGVGAVNNFQETTSFTNFGAPVDIVAPTGSVTTDISGADGDNADDYTTHFGGTSSACPVAAGVAGLLAAAAPDKTGPELADALIHSARQSIYATPAADGHDDYYGYGEVDPAHALRMALNLPEPVDAGPAVDAASPPAGSGGDAPATPGCTCSSPPATSVPWGVLLLAAFFRPRRRP